MTSRRARLEAILGSLLAGAIHSGAVLAQDGETSFDTFCAACHVNPTDENIPPLDAIRALDPNGIVDALTVGNMRLQGQALSESARIAVAEYLTGREVRERSPPFTAGLCDTAPGLPRLGAGTVWNGWGPDARNTRYQADPGGLVAGDVPELELRWAFGIPDAMQSRSQPAVVGDRLFIGSQSGAVYALNARTGCTFWSFQADTWVRTAVSVGPYAGGYAVYFADAAARAYAVDAASGRLIWSHQIDGHPAARATGSPTLQDGRLYVVASGVSEETAAAMPDYECCTFRGSLTSLDAETGDVIWKTYTVPVPERRGTSTSGKPLWGPAGSPIWSSPSVDSKRGLVYAATGNSYADPDVGTSDAVVAFSIETGEIRWINQLMPGDVWILGCDAQSTGNENLEFNPNCPEDVGPDFDFSASPGLVTMADGRDLLVVTQKSGVGYALDPDAEGAKLWEYRWGQGSPVGGVWGSTTDGERAYFAVADNFTPAPGGVHAVDLVTGQRVWSVGPHVTLCEPGPGCSAVQSAALTSIPGVVFAGSIDGGIRAYAAETGEVTWSDAPTQAFETVNGVDARGASMDGPGPVVVGGMLYVTAGYGGFVGRPGNVLLAFAVRE
jgi:polyvinyl alcohol dehydrogenase (cytochrome)